jgi:lipoyl(octanoyl) transferase
VNRPVRVVDLGRSRYEEVFEAMRAYTQARDETTEDQIWITEHERVFTQGQAGKPEHLLLPGEIPVVQTDRGGQVTYHGPGQIVGYLLFDLRRLGLTVRGLVTGIEEAVIRTLAGYGIEGAARADAPGVYVDGAKIASLGLRVRRGCSYHGLSLNVNMDLEPFGRINPCGLAGIEVVQVVDLGGPGELERVTVDLLGALAVSYSLELRMSGTSGSSAA